MAKRNIYKVVEADTLVPTANEDICAWWYSKLNKTLWRFDESSEQWIVALESGGASSYVLPAATKTTLGGIKVGDGLNINNGVLSVNASSIGYQLPTATTSVLGGIKVGSTLTISNGVLNVKNSFGVATKSTLGGIKIGYTEDEENGLYAVKLDSNNRAYVEVTNTGGGGITEIPLATETEIGGFIARYSKRPDDGIHEYYDVYMDSSIPSTGIDYGTLFVRMNYASSVLPGVIKIGFTAEEGRENLDIPVLLNNNNKAYVTLPEGLGGDKVESVTVDAKYDATDISKNNTLATISVTDTKDGTKIYDIATPFYTVKDSTTGLQLSNFEFTMNTAGVNQFGTVKTQQSWTLNADTISEAMWKKWTEENWYYRTLEAYINEGRIYFRQWLQSSLLTSNINNISLVEDTGKINLNVSYTPYATLKQPEPTKVTVTGKDVSEHIADLYKKKAELDSETGWIEASQLPDGFYSEYILCEAALDDAGKGNVYTDIEDPLTILTPKETALYFDTLTNTSYRYIGEIDGQHQFMEVSKELVYTSGGDNVQITVKREIKVDKTTGVGDTYVTDDEIVTPIRRIIQKYNNYLTGIIEEIGDNPVENQLYYGIPSGDYVQKKRVYKWNATTSTYEELTDLDGNILFDDDIIIYLDNSETNGNLDPLLTEGARNDKSYTVLAYQVYLYANIINPLTTRQIKILAKMACKDVDELTGILTSDRYASIPVIDYNCYQKYKSEIADITTASTVLVAYKWLKNGSDESRLYDEANYYKAVTLAFNDGVISTTNKSFIYQRPQMENINLDEIQDAYTSITVGEESISATGKDGIKLVAGSNVVLDLNKSTKELKISSTGGGSGTGAVDSVNGYTGTVVLTATDVDAYSTSVVDSKVNQLQTAIDGKINLINGNANGADVSYFPTLKSEYKNTVYEVEGSQYAAGEDTFVEHNTIKWQYFSGANTGYTIIYTPYFDINTAGAGVDEEAFKDRLCKNNTSYSVTNHAGTTIAISNDGGTTTATYNFVGYETASSSLLATEQGVKNYVQDIKTNVATLQTQILEVSSDVDNLGTSINEMHTDVVTLQNSKQNKLTAGENVTISDDNVISATCSGVTYTAGDNVQISEDNVISATNTTYTAGNNIAISDNNEISATSIEYTAGENITISEDKQISATDTTYEEATTTTSGLMSATDKTKVNVITTDGDGNSYLANDGTYKIVSSGTTYTAGNNIKISDADEISALGYSYDSESKLITTEGDVKFTLTDFDITANEIVEEIDNKINIVANAVKDNVPILTNDGMLKDSGYYIGSNNFAKTVYHWESASKDVYCEAFDKTNPPEEFPPLSDDVNLESFLKNSITSYDAENDKITTYTGEVFYFVEEITNEIVIATEQGVINYINDKKYITDASSDDKLYGRKNGAWTEITNTGVLNAFSNVIVGDNTMSASGEDSLTLAAGDNITLSVDDTNKKVTINATQDTSALTNLEYAAGTCATTNNQTGHIALYDNQISKTSSDEEELFIIDNVKNTCSFVYSNEDSTATTYTPTIKYSLYKNSLTLINNSLEYNKYRLCATGVLYIKTVSQLTVTCPTTIETASGSTLSSSLTVRNFYGSTQMVIPANSVGILYFQINAIDDNFTDAIACMWGDVQIS